MTEKDLEDYRFVTEQKISIFNLMIIDEVMCVEGYKAKTEKDFLFIADTVAECVLKSDEIPTYQIAQVVYDNFLEIRENNYGPREILRRYI